MLHVREVLRTTPEENLRLIRESLAYLKAHGREVIYDAEHFFDGYKLDPDYALQTLQAALDGGADLLVLCDTNGGTMPWEVERSDATWSRSVPRRETGHPHPQRQRTGRRQHAGGGARRARSRCRARSTATASAAAMPTCARSCPTWN